MNLEEVIQLHGWNVAQIAPHIKRRDGNKGVSPSQLYNNIRTNPTLARINEIANIIQVPLLQIIAEMESLTDPLQYDASVLTCPHCGKYIRINTEIKYNAAKA
jgi:hypothetical protein